MLARKPLTCPACRVEVPWSAASFPQFSCPSCGTGLHFRGAYFRVANFAALVILGLCAYAVGVRGDTWLAVLGLGFFPAAVVVQVISMFLFAPDLEATGDFHGILYGVTPSDVLTQPSELDESAPPAEAPTSTNSSASSRRPMFQSAAEPVSLEGVGLKTGALLLSAWLLWSLLKPAVLYIDPSLGTVRIGPAGFPMTVRIGELGISFTSGSGLPWKCNAELGSDLAYAHSFSLASQESRSFPFDAFRGSTQREGISTLRNAALTRVSMSCAEPSGTTHYWDFR